MALRIMLVEDDELVRETLVELMSNAGYSVEASNNAEHAIPKLVPGRCPDVLVTDINLGPGMDGLVFVRVARIVFPGLRVVFMSGRHAWLDRLGALDRFVPKPFAMSTLLTAANSVCAAVA